MILLLHGTKRLESYHDSFVVKEGDILLLKQGNYFMSEIVSDDGLYEAIMIYFDDDFITDFVQKYKLDLSRCEKKEIAHFKSDKLLKPLTTSISLYLHEELDNQHEIIKLKTQEIFLHLLAQDQKSFKSFLYAITSTAKRRIIHILEANIDIIESVEDMCRIARISKNELKNATQEASGTNPKTWLDNKRLEQAALMLKNSNKTISEIATTCGYASSSWFGVQFKKLYGYTPKDYRKR